MQVSPHRGSAIQAPSISTFRRRVGKRGRVRKSIKEQYEPNHNSYARANKRHAYLRTKPHANLFLLFSEPFSSRVCPSVVLCSSTADSRFAAFSHRKLPFLPSLLLFFVFVLGFFSLPSSFRLVRYMDFLLFVFFSLSCFFLLTTWQRQGPSAATREPTKQLLSSRLRWVCRH